MSDYGMPQRLACLITPYLVKKAVNNNRRHDNFHPSAWGSCLRRVAFEYYNDKHKFQPKTAEDVKVRMEMIFDNGHKVHERWQSYLDHANVLRGAWRCPNPACRKVYGADKPLGIFNPVRFGEFKCECGNASDLVYEEMLVSSEEYNFKGNVDGIVDVRGPYKQDEPASDSDIFVVDFKSMKSGYFDELVHAKWEHVVQVHIYMWLLNLKMGVVVYECKDDQKLKEMVVPYDAGLIERIKKESKWLMSVLKTGKLPPVPSGYSQSSIPCFFCEFSNRCY